MKILTVGTDQDDLKVLCARTLVRSIQRRGEVTAAITALCNAGTFHMNSETIARVSNDESRDAVRIIGVDFEQIPIDILSAALTWPTRVNEKQYLIWFEELNPISLLRTPRRNT